jgi:hypothetical protein
MEIDLNPTKDAYNAIQADVDENAALKELTDNCIDNGLRRGRDEVTVLIRYETDAAGDPKLVIEDDSGGLAPSELSMVFGIGQSEKENIKRSIGAFGIGAKKALMCLGDEFDIRSRHTDEEVGYEYTVGQGWLNDDETWSIPVDEVEMEAGTTEIEIRDLNFSWQAIRDELARDLARTYELYLRGETNVTLRLLFPKEGGTKTEPLVPPTRPDFSYTPWDDLYPRRYEGIVLDPPEVSSPVYMNVEVGLLATVEGEEPGIDWVCQNRVVERGNRDEVSGFGDDLPTFRLSSHKRLKGRVELYTDGDAAEIPWNSDKSRIRARDAVTEAARDVLRKIVPAYMKAKYGTVKPQFFEPYTDDTRYAANGGTFEVVNLSERFQRYNRGDLQQIQIREKPDEDLSQIKDMKATAEAHAHLGITYEYIDWVKPWMRPTYSTLVETHRKEFGCFDDLEPLDSAPPDFTTDGRSGTSERTRLAELASQHVNLGVRYTGIGSWERPRYEFELAAAADDRNIDVDALDPVDELPEIEDDDGQKSEEATKRLSFGSFTESDLDVLRSHLGDVDEYSPEKRKEVLIDHFKRLNMAGVRFEVNAD